MMTNCQLDKIQWNFNQNAMIFIQRNTLNMSSAKCQPLYLGFNVLNKLNVLILIIRVLLSWLLVLHIHISLSYTVKLKKILFYLKCHWYVPWMAHMHLNSCFLDVWLVTPLLCFEFHMLFMSYFKASIYVVIGSLLAFSPRYRHNLTVNKITHAQQSELTFIIVQVEHGAFRSGRPNLRWISH